MKFKASPTSSLGMEIELQLLDSQTLELADGILPLMAGSPKLLGIKPESNQATVEVYSKVCSSLQELESDIFSRLGPLHARCRRLGLALCGAGTHPTCTRLIPMTPSARYRSLYKVAGHLAYWVTFALHVHVGMPSGQEAVAVMAALKPYLPVLLALSASSPFWWGCDTGFASFRQRLLASCRSYGIPPTFRSWQAFSDFFAAGRRAKMFRTIRDIHWDLRPHPNFGTLEVRVMDSQPTVREALMLAALVHSLVVYLQHWRRGEQGGFLLTPQPWWSERENYFQASRLGLKARYIEGASGQARPLKAIIANILESLAGTAVQLGEMDYLQRLQGRLDTGPSYVRQRQAFQWSGSCQQVSAGLVKELEEELSWQEFQLPVGIEGVQLMY